MGHIWYLRINLLISKTWKQSCSQQKIRARMHNEFISAKPMKMSASSTHMWICEISFPVCSVYSRLSRGGVLRYWDGEGGIAELWRSRTSHYREHSWNAAAAQLICSHDCQQIFSVLLQGKACRPHLTILSVYFKTTIATWKYNEGQYKKRTNFTCLSPKIHLYDH